MSYLTQRCHRLVALQYHKPFFRATASYSADCNKPSLVTRLQGRVAESQKQKGSTGKGVLDEKKAERKQELDYPPYVLEIRNLPTIHRYNYDPYLLLEDVKTHFQEFGVVRNVSIYRHRNGEISTTCHVYYKSPDSVKVAMSECGGKIFLKRGGCDVFAFALRHPHMLFSKASKKESRHDSTRIEFYGWRGSKTMLWRWVAEGFMGSAALRKESEIDRQSKEARQEQKWSLWMSLQRTRPRKDVVKVPIVDYAEQRIVPYISHMMPRTASCILKMQESGKWRRPEPWKRPTQSGKQPGRTVSHLDTEARRVLQGRRPPPPKLMETKPSNPRGWYRRALTGVVKRIVFQPQKPHTFPILSLYPLADPQAHGTIHLHPELFSWVDSKELLKYLRRKDSETCEGATFDFAIAGEEQGEETLPASKGGTKERSDKPVKPKVIPYLTQMRKRWIGPAMRGSSKLRRS